MRNRLKIIFAIVLALGTAIQTNAQKMNKVPTVKLNNGMEMPQLGVGTFLVKDDAAERVCHAIKVGFRLFDTAQGYGNEKEVGEGIRRSGIDRRELFITTKVNTTEMRNGTVRQSLDKSFANLGTDYIDLVLIHWPVKGHIKETWQILEEYVDKGKIRSIGVSNFNPHHLDELLEYARIRPVINQIEVEPYMIQQDVVGYTFRKGIQVEAWGPLGAGKSDILTNPVITEIAKKRGLTPAQVVLGWNLERGVIVIPKSIHKERLTENLKCTDFELTDEDKTRISALNKNLRLGADPDHFNF